MDFSLSEAESAFQQEVRRFLETEATSELNAENNAGQGLGPLGFQFLQKLGKKRWLVPMLPVEYGGLGATFMQRHILMREMSYYLPSIPPLVGAGIVAPSLFLLGTDEQKAEYLPKISLGEVEFALGYTEPQAGSDVSSIDIRAVEDGDSFVLNGQKTFNTGCHYAQFHWLCARTSVTTPKHRGLSLFIVPMNSPGIKLHPLWTMGGERTNEVFYDNVRIPKKNLVGQLNRGFSHVMTALNYERVFATGHLKRAVELLAQYVKETKRNGSPLAADPLVRQKLAEIASGVEVAEMMSVQMAYLCDQGQVPEHQASAAKIAVTELEQQVAQYGLSIMGWHGQLMMGSKHAPLNGWFQHLFLSTARRTVSAGANEIQRNIIAQRGLGLPRA